MGMSDIKSKGGIFLASRREDGLYEICTRQFCKATNSRGWEPARNAFVGNSLQVVVEMNRRERLMGVLPCGA